MTQRRFSMTLAVVLTVTAGLLACACGPAAMTARPTTGGTMVAPKRGGMPHTDGAIRAIEGRVRDVERAGYLYALVEADDGEQVWVVSLDKPLMVGERVAVRTFGARRHFESRGLHRTFDRLWFAVITPLR